MKKHIIPTINILYKCFSVHISKYILRFMLLIILASVSKILNLIPPYINGNIIDFVLKKDFNKIVFLIIMSFIISLAMALLSLGQTYLANLLSNKSLAEVKGKIYHKILYLKMHEFDKKSVGEYISRIDGDTNSINNFYVNTIPNLFISIITLIVSGIFSFYISPLLSIVGIVNFPISIIIFYFFGKKMKESYSKVRNASDEYSSMMNQALHSERTIKGLHIEESILSGICGKLNNLCRYNIKNGMISAYGGLVQLLVSIVLELLLMAIACYLIIEGVLSIGLYVAFNVYLSNFLSSLRTIASTNLNIQTVLVSISRVDEIMDNNNEEVMGDSTEIISGDIEVSNLGFSFNPDYPLFKDLSIKFFAKEITAIVGLSGCGKTTLLNLIAKIYDYEKGSILIDNRCINDLSLHDLRSSISYVQQEPFIFNDTIKNNLFVANPDATNEEIIDACKKAHIFKTIDDLPSGFDTVIGEHGYNFSGGQKQRLAIARGIIKKSKIFLLDEITSDLDGETEKFLLRTLNNLSKTHTVLLVAHRLTTVMNIARIIVLHNGRIIEIGNHEQLIAKCEIYRNLFDKAEVNE